MSRKILRHASFDSSAITLVDASEYFQRQHKLPLQLGNIVSLNSGGPRMMIVDLDGDGGSVVSWWGADGATQENVNPARVPSSRFATLGTVSPSA